MLPCKHVEYYGIAIIYTQRPKLLAIYNIGPYMAGITQVFVNRFHQIHAQLAQANMMANVNSCEKHYNHLQ